jgi:large conductance mechanosensitive channel
MSKDLYKKTMFDYIKNLFSEFKKFAVRGNMIELAVGLTVGAAFGRLVSSLVNDVIMPPIGYLLARVSFDNLYINLSRNHYNSLQEAEASGAPVIKYGQFLNTLIDFLIVAFTIFIIVRAVNHLRVNSLLEKKSKKIKKIKSK